MSEPAPTRGAPSESAAERLATVLRYYRQAMSNALNDEDFHPIMPAATWLLLAMARQPGTVGELALRLGTSKQAVSRLSERLVGLGYCDRRRGATNRRLVMLTATDEGSAAAAALRAAIEAADAILLAGLDEGERDAFRRVLAHAATASIAAARPG
jgi:DNA-binding MarR family transcriptional regulator